MAQRYLFRPYPAYRYKTGETPVIVHTEAEDNTYLSKGWHKTPKEQILNEIKELEVTDEVEKAVEKAVDATAAMTNMILRIPKCRSKKDLRFVAEQLEIAIPGDATTLKQMRAVITEGAKNLEN